MEGTETKVTWWNTSDAVSRFNFWMQIGILVFGLLTVAASAFSLLATRRIEALGKIDEKSRQERLEAAEIATEQLKQDLTNAHTIAQEANKLLLEEQKQKKIAEEKRQTPPRFTVHLSPHLPSQMKLEVRSENLIPFESQFYLLTDGRGFVSGVPIEWHKFYPTETNRSFTSGVNLSVNKIRNGYLELVFKYKSLFAEELNLPGHSGTIIQRFKIAENGQFIRQE